MIPIFQLRTRTMQRSELTLQDFQRKNKEKLLPKRRWNEPMLDYEISMHGPCRSQPSLLPSSLSDTQDQRQVLTSLMAHRNRVLADYRLDELREVYLEIFCTTKTSVDNPLLAPSGHGGRKTSLVIDEGYLGSHEGYWVENEEERMAQKGSLKQMRIPSGSTTMRTTHGSRGASKEEK
eukprot:s2413_g8.t1